MAKCAPQFYQYSCERACTETGSEAGSGVVEGSQPGDATGLGGIEVTCAPPQPSWILGPFNYGAHEDTSKQCERIQSHQQTQYAQRVLKSGWLWKKGRDRGWDERYFILESGDSVRSAILRYWNANPAKSADAQERREKGILLRDAKGITAKDGEHYGFENGEQCFKIYHFYRDYRLCVVANQKATSPEEERNQWVKLIESAIGE